MKQTRTIELTRGLFALVDADDYANCAQYNWQANHIGNTGRYRALALVNGKQQYLHRFILGLDDDRTVVDHINGDPLDNTRANLRACSIADNAKNQRVSRKNSTGFKGVARFKRDNCYRAYISQGGKQRHLGYFDTAQEAACAYDAAARTLFGPFAALNFPVVLETSAFKQVEHIVSNEKRGSRKRAGSKSGYKGVSWNCQHEKWWVRVYEGRKAHSVGLFRCPLEAARAYDLAARAILGLRARLNFPESAA